MGLRFFTDHCVPNAVISRLRDAGHPVFVLRDHIPTDSDDPVVIAKVQELDTILVSLNGDFSDIVMYPPSHYKGIVALQVKNRPEALSVFMDRLMKYVTVHPEMGDYAGRLFLLKHIGFEFGNRNHMMAKDTQLHQAQENIQTIWRFLEAARETHSPLDYQRLATPYLLQLQERQQEVVEYLSRETTTSDVESVCGKNSRPIGSGNSGCYCPSRWRKRSCCQR